MSNVYRNIAGPLVCIALVLLAGCRGEGEKDVSRNPIHAPCSASGSVFAEWQFDDWQKNYHDRVAQAVESHLSIVKNTSTQALQCTEESAQDVLPPSGVLTEIARGLPAWKTRLADLGEGDMATVLLEFLRVYECSMLEYEENIIVNNVRASSASSSGNQNANDDDGPLNWFGLVSRERFVRDRVEEEMRVARPTLERTLTFVQGYDRIHPLTTDIECLKRTSLDLRNVLGLVSDASSCLPRIWDAQGSLYDLTPAPQSTAP